MTDRHAPLWARMFELKDLEGVLGLLSWDEETYAPSGARPARGRQTGTVEALRHQRLVDPALGDQIQGALADGALTAEQHLMAKRLERQRNLAVKVPESLVKAFAEARSTALEAWQKAKKERNFFADGEGAE
jgi:carboxypeptidase Taq